MIQYSSRGLSGAAFLLFTVKGSVFPRALLWGIPNAVAAFFVHMYLREYLSVFAGFNDMWSGYTVLLGFLIVFRNSHGHARFWESATLMQQLQGEWKNAINSV